MRLNSPQMNIIYKACIKASRSLIRDFGEIEKLQVSSKGPGDFVSVADKKTENLKTKSAKKRKTSKNNGYIWHTDFEKFRNFDVPYWEK